MKNLSLLFISFLLLQLNILAQDGWHEQISGTTEVLNSVYFIDNNNGFIVGDNGTFIKTTDAGENWIYHSTGTSSNLNSVHFLNTDVGFAAGGYSDTSWVIKTTDGGENWIPQPVNAVAPFMELRTIQFIDSNTGWTAGWKTFAGFPSPVLYKTTDGGSNWIHKTLPFLGSGWLISLHFIDANEGWAVCAGLDSSAIINTIDGGENWIIQKSGITGGLYCVQFINENVGWVGGSGAIFKTTDGGTNWVSAGTPSITTTSVCFVDESNGWIVSNANIGYAGMIQHSTDGGETWMAQLTDVKPLWSIQFLDEYTGWAVGDSGTIYHTTNGGATFVEENEVDELPTGFSLSNNFPNPFNPSTKIKYSVPQSSNVIIKVFDILGSEIETLVSEEKPAGTYEIIWYAEGLPSGVYFYQLKAGDFIQTKKMVLMK
jgi:photosystem II stability/assembly factor-like uncharacterized protein